MSPTSARPRLRTRLIAWYAGSLCLVLLAAALAVRFAVARVLDRAHEESMASSVDLFRQFFRVEIAEYHSVEATLVHIAGELVFDDRAIDVHRPDGALFVPPGVRSGHRYPRLRPPVREMTAPLDSLLAPGWTIEVHGSAFALVAASRRLDYWLLGGIPLVVCLAAVMGWLLAGRALRPIGRMAEQAQRLDATSGARLTLHDPADELGRFGASFNSVLDRLDTAVYQQRRFLADAAHELRTPLARLRSRVELGRLDLAQGTDREARRHAEATLGGLERELQATAEVVGSLLALARAEAGESTLSLSDGFVDDVLTDELPRWRESAAAAAITVTLGRFDEAPATFDAALLRRLLGLLLDNAIQYSPAGTTVTIHLIYSVERVRLTVEDQGIGIDEYERESVFDRFRRSSRGRAHRADGSGLGLALARWIVQQHRGDIVAVSRADGGPGIAMVAEWRTRPAHAPASRAGSESNSAIRAGESHANHLTLDAPAPERAASATPARPPQPPPLAHS